MYYNREQEDKWRSGKLCYEWTEKYPSIFDKKLLGKAINRLDYYFGEWYSAIHFFNEGWNVLVEDYMFSKNNSKRQVVEKLLGSDVIKIIQDKNFKKTGQAPDLFCYKDNGEWFFAEIKKGKDIMKIKQKKHFQRIEKAIGKKIIVVKLLPEK